MTTERFCCDAEDLITDWLGSKLILCTRLVRTEASLRTELTMLQPFAETWTELPRNATEERREGLRLLFLSHERLLEGLALGPLEADEPSSLLRTDRRGMSMGAPTCDALLPQRLNGEGTPGAVGRGLSAESLLPRLLFLLELGD